MFLEADDILLKKQDCTKTIYVYQNSSNNKQPVQFKIRNQQSIFKDIAQILKYRKLRLFNEEGAEYFEDDIQFVKNKASLYASKGEEFDPQNCFGQYEIIEKLGQGGFGQVFLANHRHTGEKCAIKFIKISSASDIDSIFVEAQILKSLKHDNIVKVTNCLTLKNMQVAIIMEYLEGGQLLNYVQKQGRLDEDTCKIFCRQIIKGIQYCHDNNLIHRDLKLENIVLVNSQQKKIKIIDFGIAGVMSRFSEDDLDTGSLGYMAPECFNIDKAFKFDGKMDVWAIGVILFSMLSGQLPFKGKNNHEIKQNIKKGYYRIPFDVKKNISKQCLNVLFRCLDTNSKTRIKIGQLMLHDWLRSDHSTIKLEKEPFNSSKNIKFSVPPVLDQMQENKEQTMESMKKIVQQRPEKTVKNEYLKRNGIEKQNRKNVGKVNKCKAKPNSKEFSVHKSKPIR